MSGQSIPWQQHQQSVQPVSPMWQSVFPALPLCVPILTVAPQSPENRQTVKNSNHIYHICVMIHLSYAL